MKYKFKKGDYVYYYSPGGETVPASVFRVGRTHPNWWTKFRGKLLIDGNWPHCIGTTRKWVDADDCILQNEAE